jgi:hypothetical protein
MRTRPINSVRSARKPGVYDWGAPVTSCGKVEENLPDRAAYLGHGWTACAALTRGLAVHLGALCLCRAAESFLATLSMVP